MFSKRKILVGLKYGTKQFFCLCTLCLVLNASIFAQIDCGNDFFSGTEPGTCGATLSNLSPTISFSSTEYDQVQFTISGATDLEGFDDASGSTFNKGINILQYRIYLAGTLIDSCSRTIEIFDFEPGTSDACWEKTIVREDGVIAQDPAGILSSLLPMDNCNGVQIELAPLISFDNCGSATSTLISGPDFSQPILPGLYELTFEIVDDSNNTTQCIVELEVNTVPSFQILPDPNITACVGDVIELNPSLYIEGSSINWTGPNGYTSNDLRPDIEMSELFAGTYTLVYETANGCTSVASIDLLLSPEPAIELFTNAPICSGDLELSANPLPGSGQIASWEWWGPCDFTSDNQSAVINDFTIDCVGEYFVSARTNLGCVTTESIAVSSLELPQGEPNSVCEDVICPNSQCTVIATEYIEDVEYEWMYDEGIVLNDGSAAHLKEVVFVEEGTFEIRYRISYEGCFSDWISQAFNVISGPISNNDEFETTINQMVTGNLLENDNFDGAVALSIVENPNHGSLDFDADGSFNYTPEVGFLGTDFFTYSICLECNESLCSESRVDINVSFSGTCEVPTVLTPNEDGRNDKLIIDCLTALESNLSQLSVYNQWGDRVFSASPYTNDWEANLNGNREKPLPDGTYYFIFQETPNAEFQKGSITILR